MQFVGVSSHIIITITIIIVIIIDIIIMNCTTDSLFSPSPLAVTQDLVMALPPITRFYTSACFLTTLACQLEIVSPFQVSSSSLPWQPQHPLLTPRVGAGATLSCCVPMMCLHVSWMCAFDVNTHNCPNLSLAFCPLFDARKAFLPLWIVPTPASPQCFYRAEPLLVRFTLNMLCGRESMPS